MVRTLVTCSHPDPACVPVMLHDDPTNPVSPQVPVTRPEAGPGHGWTAGNDYAAPLAPYSKPSSHASWRSAGSPMLPRPHPGHAHSSSLQVMRDYCYSMLDNYYLFSR